MLGYPTRTRSKVSPGRIRRAGFPSRMAERMGIRRVGRDAKTHRNSEVSWRRLVDFASVYSRPDSPLGQLHCAALAAFASTELAASGFTRVEPGSTLLVVAQSLDGGAGDTQDERIDQHVSRVHAVRGGRTCCSGTVAIRWE